MKDVVKKIENILEEHDAKMKCAKEFQKSEVKKQTKAKIKQVLLFLE